MVLLVIILMYMKLPRNIEISLYGLIMELFWLIVVHNKNDVILGYNHE